MMGLIALTTSLSAWIIGKIVDKIFVGRNLKAVWEITAAIVAIYTVKGLATYGQQVVAVAGRQQHRRRHSEAHLRPDAAG